MQNLTELFTAGLTIWVLCGGALLCLLVDSIWPKKMASVVYALGVLSLGAALATAWHQWQSIANTDTTIIHDLLVIDLTTIFFLLILIVMGILTLLNALGYIKIHQTLSGEFCTLLIFSLIGMVFLFASDHLLVNFIGLETMSMAIYVLVGSHKRNFKSNEAAIKYFIMGGVASAVLLYGIALFYGGFSTFRLSEIALQLPAHNLAYLQKIALALVLSGIFFKIAIVPFHFWAPDVYEGAPAPVTGFMATAVKTAALAFSLRVFISLNFLSIPEVPQLLSILVVLTLLTGNVVALVQENIKRMLAYSSISHAGFLLFGILAGFKGSSYDASSSSVILFYLLGYYLMTLGAFAILSLLTKEKSEASDYSDIRGLAYKHPILASVFTLFMFALIGMPGTVGFAAKYGIISLAVKNNHIPLALFSVIMSVVSVFYYLKPSVYMFFKDEPKHSIIREVPVTVTVSLTICAFLVLYLGLNPDTFLTLTKEAAAPLQTLLK